MIIPGELMNCLIFRDPGWNTDRLEASGVACTTAIKITKKVGRGEATVYYGQIAPCLVKDSVLGPIVSLQNKWTDPHIWMIVVVGTRAWATSASDMDMIDQTLIDSIKSGGEIVLHIPE